MLLQTLKSQLIPHVLDLVLFSYKTRRPVAFASRVMSDTAHRHTQVENEALVIITWACEKFSTYILGKKFMIEIDHKLLVPILGTKHLDDLPPRVLRFRLHLSRFEYEIRHVPGKLTGSCRTCLTESCSLADLLMQISVDCLPASAQCIEAQASDGLFYSIVKTAGQRNTHLAYN